MARGLAQTAGPRWRSTNRGRGQRSRSFGWGRSSRCRRHRRGWLSRGDVACCGRRKRDARTRCGRTGCLMSVVRWTSTTDDTGTRGEAWSSMPAAPGSRRSYNRGPRLHIHASLTRFPAVVPVGVRGESRGGKNRPLTASRPGLPYGRRAKAGRFAEYGQAISVSGGNIAREHKTGLWTTP